MDIDLAARILALVDKYGLSLVFLIGLITWLALWLMPRVDVIWKEFVNNRSERLQAKSLNVNKILAFDLQVNGLLGEVMNAVGSDWAQLWQFHNGVYSLGLPHIPFLFATITHEAFKPGVTPMSVIYRSLPTAIYDRAAERFATDDIIITVAHGTDIPFSMGASTNCLLPIRDGAGHLAALMAISYAKPHEVTPQETVQMKIDARRIGIFMATALKESAVEQTRGISLDRSV